MNEVTFNTRLRKELRSIVLLKQRVEAEGSSRCEAAERWLHAHESDIGQQPFERERGSHSCYSPRGTPEDVAGPVLFF